MTSVEYIDATRAKNKRSLEAAMLQCLKVCTPFITDKPVLQGNFTEPKTSCCEGCMQFQSQHIPAHK